MIGETITLLTLSGEYTILDKIIATETKNTLNHGDLHLSVTKYLIKSNLTNKLFTVFPYEIKTIL